MNIFVAAQPIFDTHMNAVSYEILHRSSDLNRFTSSDHDFASTSVINNTFSIIGINELTGGRPAFINFTRELVLNEIASLFPQNQLVIEVTENIEICDQLLKTLSDLKREGYRISLDNVELGKRLDRLMPLADFVKVDFTKYGLEEIKTIRSIIGRKAKLIAVKVETMEMYKLAQQLHFDLFQGFFFTRPIMHHGKDLPPFKANYLNLISKVNEVEISFDEIAMIVRNDTSLSYKLLTLVNSIQFSLRKEVSTIRQAVVVLGQDGLRKWISLLAIKRLGEDKPLELVRVSLIRAKFLETLAARLYPGKESEYFLLGLLSVIDAMLECPIEESLEKINVSATLKEALIKRTGEYSDLLQLIYSYEYFDATEIEKMTKKLEIEIDDVSEAYISACHWYNEVMNNIKS